MNRIVTVSICGALVMTVALGSGPARAADSIHEIQITARKFEFTPAVIQVSAGERVRLVVRSGDSEHGFAIRALKIDLQLRSDGTTAITEFTAPPAGRYEISCSVFCGSGHGHMKATLVSIGSTATSQ